MSARPLAVEEPPTPLPRRFAAMIETFAVRWRRHIRWLQGAMLLVFVVVAGLPVMLPDPAPGATALTDLRLALSYLLWGIWFPLVFLSVIPFGRVWCGVLCPMGAATEAMNKIGLKRPIPAWIRWEGTPAISFIITTLYGQTLGVRDHPEAAAGIFGGTMLLAMLIGYVYGRDKRVWCRHVCPIGRVLGLYSRLGILQFASRLRLPGTHEYSERGLCPTMIDLSRKTESRHCIACFRCVQPKAANGMRVSLRAPGDEIENIRDHRANGAEAWFLFLDTGVALGGFLWLVLPWYQDARQSFGEWAIERGWDWIVEVGPAWLMSVHPARAETFMWLDFLCIVGFMVGCMLLLSAILAATTALAAGLARRAGAEGGFGRLFTELGYQYAPVALMSLVIGLGAELLAPLRETPLGETGIHVVRGGLFAFGVAWSVWLGYRLTRRMGLSPKACLAPLVPGLLGSLVVGIGWWPAIFGI